ncbi:MAG TPA: phosphoribosyltransferase family protein, partial [Saprospiraceae bacterium]|nr:phosphoribosyltransferase family protein [Saprospiraceae bacterium]
GGAALYYYIKGGRLQQAMEGLKYRNRPDIGLELGRFYGMLLRDHDPYRQAQLILPVPLHPKRKAQRGYNQSAMVAKGLFESMGIPFREDLLVRKKETNSQTEKNRMDRVVNMQSAFELKKPELLKNLHLLLVDDILTTGATLEACARLLTRVEGTRISLVTLAMTK